MYRSEYVINIDFDEYLSSRHHTSLLEFLREQDAVHEDAAAYSFNNFFFSASHEVNHQFDNDSLPFDMFHTTRSHGPWEHKKRSKVVLR